MTEQQKKFPDYFPEGCPPASAKDSEITLYRLCKDMVPCKADFVSFYLINPEKYRNCINAYGLSVFPSIEDCNIARSKAPRLRKKPYSAKGENNEDRGKYVFTPSNANPNHITWWVYEGVEPHTFFEICNDEVSQNG